jgi:protein-disulfide isomerase
MALRPPSESFRKWADTLSAVGFLIACVVFATFVVIDRTKAQVGRAPQAPAATKQSLPAEPVDLADAPILGSPSARVVLLEYSDFQCPFCGKFARDVFPEVKSEFIDTGRIRVAFRQFPLGIHKQAIPAAKAALCAADSGRFWEMHERLFEEGARLLPKDLRDYAVGVGVSRSVFEECMDRIGSTRIDQDIESGRAIGVTGTPAFLVGVVEGDNSIRVVDRLSGTAPVEVFRAMIQKAIETK